MTNHWSAFDARARALPDAVAIAHGEQLTSFGALRDLALGSAAGLAARGIRRGDRVVLCLDPGAGLAGAMLGAWALGAIAVLVDVRGGAAAYRHAAEVSAASLAVVDRDPPDATALPHVLAAELPAAPGPLPRSPLPTEPASILFTSGSTGLPKGVVQSHGSLVRGARTVAGMVGLTPQDRLLCGAPWTFDYGFVNLQMTLVSGAAHVLPDKPASPFAVPPALERHRPTMLAGIPALFGMLVGALGKLDNAGLRAVTSTGGTIAAPVLDALQGALPHADLFLNYGLTESFRTACLPPALARQVPTSIGGGIPGVEVVVVREDGVTRCAPGEQGELVHRGDYLFLGYWGNPGATAKRLRPDPWHPGPAGLAPRVLYTGDQGVIDDRGLLYFRGRTDRLLKSMGIRVSPDEVEAALHESGLVHEVAAYGVPHDMLGHEVRARVVLRDGVTARQLATWARGAMAPHLVPRRLVEADALPRTHTGKVDYPEVVRLDRLS